MRLYIFGLMAVFFMSTTGVAVYKHYCNQSKMAQSYFVMLESDCNMPEMAEADCQIDCCHKEKGDETQMHDDCCTNNMEYFQINSDLIIHDFKVEIPKILPSTQIIGLTLTEITNEDKKGLIVIVPPPNLTTPQRLSLIQTYLI